MIQSLWITRLSSFELHRLINSVLCTPEGLKIYGIHGMVFGNSQRLNSQRLSTFCKHLTFSLI